MTKDEIDVAAEAAFMAGERVRILELLNTPVDYEERKKAFVELAIARVAAIEADTRLRALVPTDRSDDCDMAKRQ